MDIKNLMKQAQQMQSKMQQAQEEIEKLEMTGQSGGGLVKVIMTGRHKVTRVTLDHSLLEESVEILEDLIAAAFNDASNKVDETSKRKLSALTAGLDLPEGLGGITGE